MKGFFRKKSSKNTGNKFILLTVAILIGILASTVTASAEKITTCEKDILGNDVCITIDDGVTPLDYYIYKYLKAFTISPSNPKVGDTIILSTGVLASCQPTCGVTGEVTLWCEWYKENTFNARTHGHGTCGNYITMTCSYGAYSYMSVGNWRVTYNAEPTNKAGCSLDHGTEYYTVSPATDCCAYYNWGTCSQSQSGQCIMDGIYNKICAYKTCGTNGNPAYCLHTDEILCSQPTTSTQTTQQTTTAGVQSQCTSDITNSMCCSGNGGLITMRYADCYWSSGNNAYMCRGSSSDTSYYDCWGGVTTYITTVATTSTATTIPTTTISLQECCSQYGYYTSNNGIGCSPSNINSCSNYYKCLAGVCDKAGYPYGTMYCWVRVSNCQQAESTTSTTTIKTTSTVTTTIDCYPEGTRVTNSDCSFDGEKKCCSKYCVESFLSYICKDKSSTSAILCSDISKDKCSDSEMGTQRCKGKIGEACASNSDYPNLSELCWFKSIDCTDYDGCELYQGKMAQCVTPKTGDCGVSNDKPFNIGDVINTCSVDTKTSSRGTVQKCTGIGTTKSYSCTEWCNLNTMKSECDKESFCTWYNNGCTYCIPAGAEISYDQLKRTMLGWIDVYDCCGTIDSTNMFSGTSLVLYEEKLPRLGGATNVMKYFCCPSATTKSMVVEGITNQYCDEMPQDLLDKVKAGTVTTDDLATQIGKDMNITIGFGDLFGGLGQFGKSYCVLGICFSFLIWIIICVIGLFILSALIQRR